MLAPAAAAAAQINTRARRTAARGATARYRPAYRPAEPSLAELSSPLSIPAPGKDVAAAGANIQSTARSTITR